MKTLSGNKKSRITITDKENCTGCGACQNVCPRDAISMLPDEEGFPYPDISDQCIDCGKCVQVCPPKNILPIYGKSLEEATVFASWSNDTNRRIKSTSGGLFSELAISVYDQGGVVIGAVYDERFMVHHIASEKAVDLNRLRQSKYAQSDIRFVFREIKHFLMQDCQVLFCGTPCQAAGLRAFLGEMPEKLLLCDFICRGINSPKAYASYLKMLEEKYCAKITNVQFKNKDKGWNQFHTKITFENGAVHHQDRYTDPFMQAYLKYNLIIRPCCHVCKFKGEHRNVDLSLGDFWGVGNYMPALDENKGTSVVLANTEKGKRAFEMLKDQVTARIMTVDQVYAGNSCLKQSAPAGLNRNRFLSSLDRLGFEEAMKRYGRESMHIRLRRFTARIKSKVGACFKCAAQDEDWNV